MTDWQRWHDPYRDPSSDLSRRLGIVQGRIRAWADAQPAGPLRILSVCAGQGHDVVGALGQHERRRDATGLLVELIPENVAAANAALSDAGLFGLEAVVGDAGNTSTLAAGTPAGLILLCGVFGNVPDRDVERTVAALPMLCAEGATIVWTRHRRDPDLTPSIRDWFEKAGFEEVGFSSPGPNRFAVGEHRLVAPPGRFDPNQTLFTFNR